LFCTGNYVQILFLQNVAEEPVFHFGLSDFSKTLETTASVDKTVLTKQIFEEDFF
jgi:hypothetical protein